VRKHIHYIGLGLGLGLGLACTLYYYATLSYIGLGPPLVQSLVYFGPSLHGHQVVVVSTPKAVTVALFRGLLCPAPIRLLILSGPVELRRRLIKN